MPDGYAPGPAIAYNFDAMCVDVENSDPIEPTNRPWSARSYRCVGLIILAAVVATGRLVFCGFTNWDDPHTVAENPGILHPSVGSLKDIWSRPIAELYVPLPYTIWWSLSALTGDRSSGAVSLNPHVFHAVSVLGHCAAGVALFAVLRRLVRTEWAACAGAALFAAHPVQVESVGWVSGLKDVLGGLFSIVALHQYVCYRQTLDSRSDGDRTSAAGSYGACAIALVLAMVSKPVAVIVPLIFAIVDLVMLGTSARRMVMSVAPMALLALPFAILARAAQLSPPLRGNVETWQWPLIVTDTIAFYIYKISWPIHLGVDYGRTPAAAVGFGSLYWNWIFPLAAVGAAVYLRRSARGLLAGAGVFLAPLLPLLGPIPFSFRQISTVADHYLYLPMAGVALAAAAVLSKWSSRVTSAVAVILIGLLAARSWGQSGVWRDGWSLFENVLVVNPRSVVARVNLAKLAMDQRDELDLAERLMFEAVQIDPNFPAVLTQAGSVLLKRASPREAVPLLEAAVARDPEDEIAHANLGSAYAMLGRPDDAIVAYERALALDATLDKTAALLRAAKAAREAATRPGTQPSPHPGALPE